jgi:hypothetical protein
MNNVRASRRKNVILRQIVQLANRRFFPHEHRVDATLSARLAAAQFAP